MTPIFYIHLVSTIINMTLIILLWWYNYKLINLNRDLMKDNRDILVEAKKQQERMNNIESLLPGTLWIDTETGKVNTRIPKESK